ncbi:MAG: phosphoglucosamine mutase [Candidatus Hodarchaeota archaeon]
MLFGTSGIRGVYGEKITDELVFRVGNALARTVQNIAIGIDQRKSSNPLSKAFIEGALKAKAEITFLGLTTTPTVGFISREYNAGVNITASHNPPEYNGLKFFNPDGSAFSEDQQNKLEDLINSPPLMTKKGRQKSQSVYKKHISAILKYLDTQLSDKHIVLDCNHGTAGTITPNVLRELGCKVSIYRENPKWDYIPQRTNMPSIGDWQYIADIRGLIKKVRDEKADLGITHDSDSDRVFIVTDEGPITGDLLLGIFASKRKGNVVAAIDSSMIVDELAKGSVIRTPVGDTYISRVLKSSDAVLGGEGCSGTFIFPEFSLCPDGPLAAAKFIEVVTKEDVKDMLSRANTYRLERFNIPCESRNRNNMMERILAKVKDIDATIQKTDGIKVIFTNGWFLIRASGTSPIIRVTIEAKDDESFKEIQKFTEGIVGQKI